MSRRLFSYSILRGISNIACEIRMLASPHQPSPTSEIQTIPLLHLPDVQAPAQYLIDMGLTPVLSTRLSDVYTEVVARYRRVLESYFRRAIHGSCHVRAEHYRDTYVVQFKGTIQMLESQFMSAAWVWLCRTGHPPTHFRPQCVDIRVDSVTKAHILSRLGLEPTFIIETTSNRIGQREEGCKNEGDSVPPPQSLTNPSTRDFFQAEKSSTCFPAYYPPPDEPFFSPRKTLVTQFKLTPPPENEKSVANCSIDMPTLTAVFGKMSITVPEADVKAREHRKCVWAPSSKTSEAPPVLSPVTAIMSGSHQNPNSEVVSSVKPITTPRRRRIAALPKRHIKATILPTRDPSLPPAANLPILRTPSLSSDTSSCSDSFSSSDELDTPPSTPPSHPPLIACNTSSTTVTSSKSNTKGPFGLSIRTNPDFPRPRSGEGICVNFTNGKTVGEQQFSFTFSA